MPAAVASEPKNCWTSVDEGQYALALEREEDMYSRNIVCQYH